MSKQEPMSPEAFEQLVCEWLAQPQQDALRARIDAAVVADPSLGRILAAQERLQSALDAMPSAAGTDFGDGDAELIVSVSGRGVAGDNVLAGSAAEDDAAADDRLSEALGRLPRLDERVDWDRFAARTLSRYRAAVTARGRQRWRRRIAVTTVAAAAVILLGVFQWPMIHSFIENRESVAGNASQRPLVATAEVHAPRWHEANTSTSLDDEQAGGPGVATVTVGPPRSEDASAAPAQGEAAEVFVMVSPPASANGNGNGNGNGGRLFSIY